MSIVAKGKNEAEKQIIELYGNQLKALDQLSSLIIFLEQNEAAIGKMTDPEDFRIYLNSLKIEKQNCQLMVDTMKPYFRSDKAGTQSLAFDTTDPKSLMRLGSLVTAASLSRQGAASSKINYEGFYDRFFRKPSGREKANPKLEKLEQMWSAFLKKNPPKDPTLIAAVGSYTIVPTQRSARVQLLSTVILEEILKASQGSHPEDTKTILMEAVQDLLTFQNEKINFLDRQLQEIKKMPESADREKIIKIIENRITAERNKLADLGKINKSINELIDGDQKALKAEIKKVVAAYSDISLEERGLTASEKDSPSVKATLQRITKMQENHILVQVQQIAEDASRRQGPNIFALMMPVKGTAVFVNKANLDKNFPLAVNNLRVQFSDNENAFRAAVEKYNITLTDAKSAIEQYKNFIEAFLPAPNFSEDSLKAVQRYMDHPIAKMREQISIPITTKDPTLAAQQLAQSIKMGFIPVVTHPEVFNPPLPKSLENLTFEIQSKKRSICIEQIRALMAAGANFRLKDATMNKEISAADYFTKNPELRVLTVRSLDPEEALKRMQRATNLGFIPVLDTDSRKTLMKFQGKSQRDLDIVTRYLNWDASPEAQAHHPNYKERARVNKSIKENQAKLVEAQATGNQSEVNKLQAKIALLKQKREQLEAGLKAVVVFKDEIAKLDKKDQILLQTLAHQKDPEGRMSALQQRRKAYGDLATVPIKTTNLDLAKLQIQRLLEQGCSFAFTHPNMEKNLKAALQNEEVVINTGDLRNVVPLFQKALDMGFIPKLGSDVEADYFNSLKAGRGSTRLPVIQVNLTAHQDPVRALQAILDMGAIPMIPSFLKDRQAHALLIRLQERERKVAKEGQQNVLQIKGPKDNIPHALKIYEALLNMGLHPNISDDLAKAIQAEAIKQEALKEKFVELGVKKGAGLEHAPKAYTPLPELRLKNTTFDSFAKLVSMGIWSPTLVERSGKKTERFFSHTFVKVLVADLKKKFDADHSKTTFYVELPGNSKNDVLYKHMSDAVLQLRLAVMEELRGSKKYQHIAVQPIDNGTIKMGLTQQGMRRNNPKHK